MPEPLPSNVQSGVNSGAYVPSPTSPVDRAGDAFFEAVWALDVKGGMSINDPTEQAQVNTATLQLKKTMSYVLSASPTYGGNIVTSTASLFSDLNPSRGPLNKDAFANDLINIEQNAKAAFGTSGQTIGDILGAMGFAATGTAGQQELQQLGQNFGALLDPLDPATLKLVVESLGPMLQS